MTARQPPSYRARLALAVGSLRSYLRFESWEIQQARLWRNRMVRADVYADNHAGPHPAGSYRLHLQSFLPCVHG